LKPSLWPSNQREEGKKGRIKRIRRKGKRKKRKKKVRIIQSPNQSSPPITKERMEKKNEELFVNREGELPAKGEPAGP